MVDSGKCHRRCVVEPLWKVDSDALGDQSAAGISIAVYLGYFK